MKLIFVFLMKFHNGEKKSGSFHDKKGEKMHPKLGWPDVRILDQMRNVRKNRKMSGFLRFGIFCT